MNTNNLDNFNSLANQFPALAAEWHPTKNGELLPSMVTPHSHKKVWWKCAKEGHEWQATIKNRTNGTGCPACKGRVDLTGYNDLASVNPALAAEWHPTRKM